MYSCHRHVRTRSYCITHTHTHCKSLIFMWILKVTDERSDWLMVSLIFGEWIRLEYQEFCVHLLHHTAAAPPTGRVLTRTRLHKALAYWAGSRPSVSRGHATNTSQVTDPWAKLDCPWLRLQLVSMTTETKCSLSHIEALQMWLCVIRLNKYKYLSKTAFK